MVAVGDCEWSEPTPGVQIPRTEKWQNKTSKLVSEDVVPPRHQAKLWVAEALVTPDMKSRAATTAFDNTLHFGEAKVNPTPTEPLTTEVPRSEQSSDQLRITLTGPTTSGKSSLLGTLTTATLDNGRGKSRLSLLKHRHEIVSGITSSVAQELVGYRDSDVINYASGNVSSWTDIHAAVENGRLVFVSDSAGMCETSLGTHHSLRSQQPKATLRA
jgi:hypothetical protein